MKLIKIKIKYSDMLAKNHAPKGW